MDTPEDALQAPAGSAVLEAAQRLSEPAKPAGPDVPEAINARRAQVENPELLRRLRSL